MACTNQFGPQLHVPLQLAERLVRQVQDAARETGWESLNRDAEELVSLITQQFPEQVILGRQVKVVRDLEVWAFAGGWGDGPAVLHPGAKLYLDYQKDDMVFFKSGSPSGTTGGKFSTDSLGAVEDDAP